MSDENTTPLGIYVTGATTGLGRAVVRQLTAQGYQVAGTARSLAEATMIRADGGLPVYNDLFRASEIASTLKLAKVNVIVNAASQQINGPALEKRDWEQDRRLVIDGAAALAEAAGQVGAQFLIHLSFAFLYGDTHGQVVSESHPIQTDDVLFGAAARAERAVLRSQVPACVLRAGYNYGPDSQRLQDLQRALISRGSVTAGTGAASWVHTSDLAAAVVRAVEQQPAGEVFNVADDHPLSPAEFVDRFADHMGVARPSKPRLPSSLRQVVLHPSQRALMDASFAVSAAKAKEQLGWSPQYPDVNSGIEQTLLAWRAEAAV